MAGRMKLLQIMLFTVCTVLVIAVFLQYAVCCLVQPVAALFAFLFFTLLFSTGLFPEILLFIRKRE